MILSSLSQRTIATKNSKLINYLALFIHQNEFVTSYSDILGAGILLFVLPVTVASFVNYTHR